MRRVLRVKQRDRSDCGAACLVSVSAYYGCRIPLSLIRRYSGTDKDGTSLLGMVRAAEKISFLARAAKARGVPLGQIPFPAIFHIVLENGFQHFVVVYRIKKNQVYYMDPAGGEFRSVMSDRFLLQWSGIVLLLAPSPDFTKLKSGALHRIRFWRILKPRGMQLSLALAGTLIYAVCSLSITVFIRKMADEILPAHKTSLLGIYGPVMIVLLSIAALTAFFKSGIVLKTGFQIDRQLIMDYYRHLLRMPKNFFDSMRTGEIVSRINDAIKIRYFVNDTAIQLVASIFFLLLSLGCIFHYSWSLGLFLFISIPVYWLVYKICDRQNAKWRRKAMESGAEFENLMMESIQGMHTIRSFQMENYYNRKTDMRSSDTLKSLYRASRAMLSANVVSEWVTGLLSLAILWYGSGQVERGHLTIGTLLSYYTLLAFFTRPVQSLIASNGLLQDAIVASDRMFEIMELEKEIMSEPALISAELPGGDLILENICFGYLHQELLFDRLDLRIGRHEITGISGKSGCGKSTLISLIMGFYSLSGGRIVIGETDLATLPAFTIRRKIAVVAQQTDLFEGDFLFNMTFNEEESDMERLFEISRKLDLHDFIMKQPQGYRTIIREQGSNLSGGQKQKIGIARAIYRNPEILILDEATASLDPDSEKDVMETLCWFHRFKKTVVIITHRTEPLRICHSFLQMTRMDDGRICCRTREL